MSAAKIQKKIEDLVIENKDEPKISKISKNNKNPFSMTRNFSSWLNTQKRLWR
jgi:hypothetical protein